MAISASSRMRECGTDSTEVASEGGMSYFGMGKNVIQWL